VFSPIFGVIKLQIQGRFGPFIVPFPARGTHFRLRSLPLVARYSSFVPIATLGSAGASPSRFLRGQNGSLTSVHLSFKIAARRIPHQRQQTLGPRRAVFCCHRAANNRHPATRNAQLSTNNDPLSTIY
jgi:hypothetical protein